LTLREKLSTISLSELFLRSPLCAVFKDPWQAALALGFLTLIYYDLYDLR